MPTFVQPFPMRSVVSEEGGTLRISIPPKRDWTALFFLVWITFWTYAGIETGHKLLKKFDLFTFVWMIGWAAGELWAAYRILYAIAGQEIIVLDSDGLTRKITLFGVGWAKTYQASDMRDLRFQPEMGAGRSYKTSRIAFDYGAKTIRFAHQIEEAEAAVLITRIKQRCTIAQTTTPQEAGTKFWQQS